MSERKLHNRTRETITRKRRTFLASVGAVGATALAGCSGGGGGGSGGDGSDGGGGSEMNGTTTSGGDLMEVTVATPLWGLWNTSRVHAIGTEMGFFEEEGLSVSKPDTEGGGSNVRLVTTGDADICVESGLMASFAAHREGAPIKIPSSTAETASKSLVWVSQAGSKYESLEDCTDAQIGFTSPGSSTNMCVEGAIDAADLANAEAVSAGGPSANYTAVLNGEIDAGFVTPMLAREGVENGEVQIVFRGSEVPPFDNTSLRSEIVNSNWLSENEEAARGYFRVQQRALQWEEENPEQAAEIWAGIQDYDADFLLDVKDSYPWSNPSEIANIDTAQQLAVDFDFIDSKLSEDELDELIDFSYLPSGW
jgi:ABC-type nitrate/sulfonate/bicarbonate transport system substrate-binding protein